MIRYCGHDSQARNLPITSVCTSLELHWDQKNNFDQVVLRAWPTMWCEFEMENKFIQRGHNIYSYSADTIVPLKDTYTAPPIVHYRTRACIRILIYRCKVYCIENRLFVQKNYTKLTGQKRKVNPRIRIIHSIDTLISAITKSCTEIEFTSVGVLFKGVRCNPRISRIRKSFRFPMSRRTTNFRYNIP